MTRNELIALLEKEFAADEEVNFSYADDGRLCRGVAVGVEDVQEHLCKCHTEVLENGVWVRYEGDDKKHVTRDAEYCKKWGHTCYASGYMGTRDDSWWREVLDREWDESTKCIAIG